MVAALDTQCPKNMVYGPCGGVGFDGSCEVAPARCGFLGGNLNLSLELARWPNAVESRTALTEGAQRMRDLMARRQVVVADFPARTLDAQSLELCADIMSETIDATLAGDAGTSRVQFSPAYRAHLISSRGLPVWAGLNCRDRNRVALEGELAALAQAGVAGVHCVTGDHTSTGARPDAQPVFDLDSTRLANLAAAAGHLVSVAEAPASPPVAQRPARLREKVTAGATVCFVNHCGGVEAIADFLGQVNDVAISYLPCVPVVITTAGAELLASFPGLVLPAGYLAGILTARDPYTAGIDAAVDLCEQILAIPGVSGVNFSGGPGPGEETQLATAFAEIARRLGLT